MIGFEFDTCWKPHEDWPQYPAAARRRYKLNTMSQVMTETLFFFGLHVPAELTRCHRHGSLPTRFLRIVLDDGCLSSPSWACRRPENSRRRQDDTRARA